MDELKLAIIAGGKGTRLGLNDRPKPMALIGGKPLLEHQIELARRYGIREIFILTGYQSEFIEEHFGDGSGFGVRIVHVIEPEPLGTAGAVKQLEGRIDGRFLVFYGDLFLDMDIDALRRFDREAPSAGTLVVHPNDHPHDSDLVEADRDNVITAFHSKQRDPSLYYRNLVNAAVYLMGQEVFRFIPKSEPSDFGRDIFPRMLKEGQVLRAYNTAEYIKDMGTRERMKAVTRDYEDGTTERRSKRHKRPAIFLDRDGTLVPYIDLLHRVEDIALYPYSGRCIRRINNSDFLALMVTNQPMVARNLCGLPDVQMMHNKLETLLAGEGAYLDDIYFCPHHPDKGFPGENPEFKIECECRKPKTGMIDEAAQEFNADITASWMIGDTTTDVQTGKNAGMQTVLLRTGVGGKDGKYTAPPDYVFDDLESAIEFILEDGSAYGPYIDFVLERLKSPGRMPHIVSVAGLARSGKTTFIRLLARALDKAGIRNRVLPLDNWLVGVNERPGTSTVRDRFRYEDIEKDIRRLLSGEEISMKIYDPYSRKIVGEERTALGKVSCLIIDGVVALDHGYLRKISDTKVYVDADEAVRAERFRSYYRWKDMPEAEIDRLYHERMKDENGVIRETRTHADIVVEVR